MILAGLTLAASGWLLAATPDPGVARAPAQCPAAISVRQQAAPVPGWEATYEPGPNHLAVVTFFDGPPAEKASLVFDDEVKAARETRAVWRFPAGGKGIWISCGYEGTTAVLSRRLPVSVRTCTVIYERGVTSAAGLPAISGIECK